MALNAEKWAGIGVQLTHSAHPGQRGNSGIVAEADKLLRDSCGEPWYSLCRSRKLAAPDV